MLTPTSQLSYLECAQFIWAEFDLGLLAYLRFCTKGRPFKGSPAGFMGGAAVVEPQANKQCDNQNNKLMWQAASEENPI